MKLISLRVRDFLGIVEADLDLSHPITWIFGTNGQGKSALREAARFALTGTARGTDASGRGAVRLIRDGAKRAAIALQFAEPDGSVVELRTIITEAGTRHELHLGGQLFTGDALRVKLRQVLGPPALALCLTDIEHVLRMSAKEQSDLLAALLVDEISLDALAEKARAMRLPEPAVECLVAGISERIPAGSGVTPAVLAGSYTSVYEMRKALKKRLKELQDRPVDPPAAKAPVPSDVELEAASETVAQAERQEQELREEIGTLKARAEERNGQLGLLAQLKKAEQDLAALPAPTEPVQGTLALAPDVAALKQAAADARQSEASARQANSDAAAEVTSARDGVQAVERLIKQIEDGDTTCPSIYAPRACPYAAEALEAQLANLPTLQESLEDARAALRDAEAAHQARLEEWQAAAAKVTETNAAVQSAEIARQRAAASRDTKRDALLERVEELKAKITALGDPVVERQTRETALLQAGRTKSEAGRLLEAKRWVAEATAAHENYARDLEAAKGDVAIHEALCSALEPRGLPLAILSECVDPFVGRVNSVLAGLVDFTVSIQAGDTLSLVVHPSGGGDARAVVLLSESEILRVGAALSIAIAIASEHRFVFIDQVDTLLPENRNRLVDSIEALLPELDSVVLIS
ncbi:MAG: AAA family ATPase, partial [Planctomycetes bacterium]|nr:AAA family ATPase [Planctomycetota bacterium]